MSTGSPTAVGGRLEHSLRAARDAGRKLLVPYVTGGARDDWLEVLHAVAAAGADAIEVGLPFSDPVMDGPTIQEAAASALERGTTTGSILRDLRGLDVGAPLVAMTYYNLVFRAGHERFARSLADAGVCGAIVPDLPLEELGDWPEVAAEAGVDAILLAALTTPDDRLRELCARSRGFVYGVSVLGVTGERTAVASSAATIASRIKAATDRPALVGFGVSTAEQAIQVCATADGVIVGSALMRRVLDGAPPDEVAALVASMRDALDREFSTSSTDGEPAPAPSPSNP